MTQTLVRWLELPCPASDNGSPMPLQGSIIVDSSDSRADSSSFTSLIDDIETRVLSPGSRIVDFPVSKLRIFELISEL